MFKLPVCKLEYRHEFTEMPNELDVALTSIETLVTWIGHSIGMGEVPMLLTALEKHKPGLAAAFIRKFPRDYVAVMRRGHFRVYRIDRNGHKFIDVPDTRAGTGAMLVDGY